MKNLVVHVGYPKCASTFIQKKVFAEIDCNYICGPQTSVLCDEKFNAKEYNSSLLETGQYDETKQLTVISSPPLSSPSPDRYNQAYFDIAVRNLRWLDSNVKVIVIVRNQLDLIKSWYVYSVTRGLNTLTSKSFNKWLDQDFSVLNPELLIRSCLDAIGAEQMLVMPVELLSVDSEMFINCLGEFLGQEVKHVKKGKVNRGYYNGYSIVLWRFLNFIFLGMNSVTSRVGFSTVRGSFWHTHIKRRYQRIKVVMNPIIGNLFPQELDLTIPEGNALEIIEKFKTGNELVDQYSIYPLEKFHYFNKK